MHSSCCTISNDLSLHGHSFTRIWPKPYYSFSVVKVCFSIVVWGLQCLLTLLEDGIRQFLFGR